MNQPPKIKPGERLMQMQQSNDAPVFEQQESQQQQGSQSQQPEADHEVELGDYLGAFA